MLNRQTSYELIDFILAQAEGYPTRVLIMSQDEGLTRYANSEVHQNVNQDQTSITITVTDNNKRSRVTTDTFDKEELKAAVADAIENLEFLPEGEEQPPLAEDPKNIIDDTYRESIHEKFTVKNRAHYLKEAIDTLDEGYRGFGRLLHSENRIAFGNSEGVRRFCRNNGIDFSALVAYDEGGSGYASEKSERADKSDVLGAFSRAHEKAKLNQDAQEIEPGSYTVILEPLAVGNILTYMSFIGFSAKSIQNQISFLTSRQGEKVFDERLNIYDDHTDENTMSLPFDFEGYPRKKLNLIRNGVFEEAVYDAQSARTDGVKNTGHSVDMPSRGGIPLHLVVGTGNEDMDDLIGKTEDGLLVTRFHYMNVINPRESLLTGLTRDGLLRIKDGEIVGALKNMRFTDSIMRMFNNISGISTERERTPGFFGNFYVPAMKIDDFRFTGKTDA